MDSRTDRMINDLTPTMRTTLLDLADRPQGDAGGPRSYSSLKARGLIGSGVDAAGARGVFLTPLAWRLLHHMTGADRPADAGRLDAAAALAEAYPACAHTTPDTLAGRRAAGPHRLYEQMRTLIEEYAEKYAARADDGRFDAAKRLADRYETALASPNSATVGDVLAELADELDLAEIRTLRLAGAAAVAAMPLAIAAARTDGAEAHEIAAALGCTTSYVRTILREQQQGAPGDSWAATYRLSRQWSADELPPGSWHTISTTSINTPRSADDLARYILDRERPRQPASARLRVQVWRTGYGETHPVQVRATVEDPTE